MSDTYGAAAPAPASEAPPVSAPAERPVDLDAPAVETPAPQRDRAPNGQFARADESAPAGEPDAAADGLSGDSETTGSEAEHPPIAAPASWKPEGKDRWSEIPRHLQEVIAEREKQRDNEVFRTQNEAAEKTKALTAKEQAAETARQQYEYGVAQALETVQRQMAGEFADIKTEADVQQLANEDPFRFIKWQAHQQQAVRLTNEARQLHQQRQQEAQTQFTNYATEQDRRFIAEHKEFSDPKRAGELRDKVILPYIEERLGIKREQLPEMWSHPFFRSFEVQRMAYDAARMYAAQKQAQAAVPKAVPQPQRPGNAGAQGNASDLASIAASGDMAAYVAARKKASA